MFVNACLYARERILHGIVLEANKSRKERNAAKSIIISAVLALCLYAKTKMAKS